MASFKCGAARDLPIVKQDSWDGQAAQERIFAWAGWPDHPAPEQARKAFLAYDSENVNVREGYKLPFADVLPSPREGTARSLPLGDAGPRTAGAGGGVELRASDAGLRAAASRLPQAEGLTEDVRDEARKVLDGYFEKLQAGGTQAGGTQMTQITTQIDTDRKEYIPDPIIENLRASASSAFHRGDGAAVPLYAFPARILLPHPHMAREAVDRLTARARERALDPGVFDENPPFFFPAEISNNRVDAYSTRMAPSTLKNFARDAEKGVALQDSHRTDQLPLGASLSGKYEEGQSDGLPEGAARTLAEFYTMQGLPDTDPFIKRARAGIARDVSVGFYPLEDGTGQPFQFRCSICNRDMLRDPDCEHVPGVPYPIRDASGNVTGQQTAHAWVENAHLAEVSPVYDGATPGAGIIKATQEAEAGRLRPEVARMLEARYRIKLPGAGHVWQPGRRFTTETQTAVQSGHGDGGTQNGGTADRSAKLHADITQMYTDQKETIPDPIGVNQRASAASAFNPELETLRAQAADGLAYRKDLIAAALAEGVRAMGEKFTPDTYRAVLEAAPIATIKRMREDWKELGDARFPNRRQTLDNDPRETGSAAGARRNPVTPVSAYQG